MATFEFKLPDIGEGIVEGEIVKWLVQVGDALEEDQPMVEVMTDKATVTISSPRAGRVAVLHGKEGELARVHAPLVTLSVEEDAAPSNGEVRAGAGAPELVPPASLAREVAPLWSTSASKVLASPVTRRIAREHGVDLKAVQGTGPSGRVLKTDVLRLVAQEPLAAPASALPVARAIAPLEGDERIPLKGLRRAIARHMVQSKLTAPHYTFVEELDATELKALRARLNERLRAAEETLQLSFLPFIAKALAASLRAHPRVNANFDEVTQELVVRRPVNLGVAVATDEGLIVPVVRDVQHKGLRALAEEIGALAAAARERRVRPEDLSGGTFTVTSLGEAGGLFATPIINHPEVAILGVHRIRPRPVVREGQIVAREMTYLSLSLDHRVIDGAIGAAFLYEVIRYLEAPELLMLETG
jgi:pyruvate dehydrogenase E2 component (dihydrolipoamide acetyltransferase)